MLNPVQNTQQLTSAEVTYISAVSGGLKYLVASSTAPAATKAMAHYVCDGTADDVEINSAITACQTAGGGAVELSEGQFNMTTAAAITASNVQIEGKGQATKLFSVAGTNAAGITIIGTGVVQVHVRNLAINCNRANNAFSDGIYISTPWTSGTLDTEHVIEDVLIYNCNNNGVEIAAGSDTRVVRLSRVHVRDINGNAYFLRGNTDCNFDACIASGTGLNGFYIESLNCHFVNCKAFYCGSTGGSNHGFNVVGYNNYFENCESQDNYQSGFYGDHSNGDTTYRNNGNTFVNCIANSNNQSGNPLYGVGFQGIDVQNWQIIGGISMTRPYPNFTQRVGISFEGTASGNYVSGIWLNGNSATGYSDTSTGTNVYIPGPDGDGNRSWEGVGAINVRNFGARGDAKRYFGAVASSGSTTVTCAAAYFTSADVGKTVLVYKEQFYGVIRTIASVTDPNTIVLSGTAGATTTTGNGYIIYGSDDSAAIQKTINFASTFNQVGNTADTNQPLGSGKVKVMLPANGTQSMYLIKTQLTVMPGVVLDGGAKLCNLLANRNTPYMIMNPYTGIGDLEVEQLGGTGIVAGNVNAQAQIRIQNLRVWHGIGAQTSGSTVIPTTVVATPSTTGGTLAAATYYYLVTSIDSTGGESKASAEANATTTGSTGSVALTWTAVSGAASYRIYRGTASGQETVYFTSATNFYTDTNAASTAGIPTIAGFAIKFQGYEFEIGKIFVKECSVAIYHSQKSDFNCDSAFLVGCGSPIRMYTSNQVRYNSIFLDSCGANTIYDSLGGVALDGSCSDVSFGNIQEFTVVGVSKTLSPVMNIGSIGGTSSKDIYARIQANNSGGTGLSIANARDVVIDMMLTNSVSFSSATNPIVTAVTYGSGLSDEIRVNGTYSSGITASTGTQVGTHTYQQDGAINNL